MNLMVYEIWTLQNRRRSVVGHGDMPRTCMDTLNVLVASSVDARTDQGEYWQVIMKDQPMPEAIEGLIIHQGSVSSPLSQEKTDCHTTTEAAANNNQLVNDSAEKKAFVKDFEPRPHHDNEVDLKGKSFVKDFEPRPDLSTYEH
ncbi:unnamed protein product [Camellia sinensis]